MEEAAFKKRGRGSLTDYYEDEGCCLSCEDAEEGCLCFECKCRRCKHYSWSGAYCRLAARLREEAEARSIEYEQGSEHGFKIVEVRRETSKALLVLVKKDDGSVTPPMWVPKSCVDPHGRVQLWLLRERGLIDSFDEVDTALMIQSKLA